MINWVTLKEPIAYQDAIVLMEEILDKVIHQRAKESVFLLEHQEVYTAGTSALDAELLNSSSIPVIYSGRGGKFTYHGQGQRVIYPILDLKLANRKQDLKLYIQLLSTWIINTLKHFGVDAYTINDHVGVWVSENNTHAKLAAIGIRAKNWVTYHGVAINITTDLSKFSNIIPCGIKDFPVTSLSKLGVNVQIQDLDDVLKKEFTKVF